MHLARSIAGGIDLHTAMPVGEIIRHIDKCAGHDSRIHLQDAFQTADHLLRMVNIALHLMKIVFRSHHHIRQPTAEFLMIPLQHTLITLLRLGHHIFPHREIHNTGNDHHHHQHHHHNTVGETLGKRAKPIHSAKIVIFIRTTKKYDEISRLLIICDRRHHGCHRLHGFRHRHGCHHRSRRRRCYPISCRSGLRCRPCRRTCSGDNVRGAWRRN